NAPRRVSPLEGRPGSGPIRQANWRPARPNWVRPDADQERCGLGIGFKVGMVHLTELEVSGEAFDRSPCPLQAKVFICSTPRTGSYLLCRAMIHHGIGIPHEYFHFWHAGIIGPRFGIGALKEGRVLATDPAARAAYIAALLERRTLNGIFASKIHWWAFERYLDNPQGTDLLRNGHFIYL